MKMWWLVEKAHISRRAEQIASFLLAAGIVLWPLLYINKGIDVSDTGYALSKYNAVFSQNKLSGITMLFSDIIGGIIYHAVPSHQLLAIRMSTWISYLVVFFLCYKLFSPYIPRILILLSILVSSLYGMASSPPFSYHNMHALFFCIGIFFLIKGLKEDQTWPLCVSGIVLAFNIFVRFPDILELFIVCAIIWYYGFCLCDWKKGLKKSGLFLLSAAIAAGCCLLFSGWFLGWERLQFGFQNLSQTGKDSEGIYNIGYILNQRLEEIWSGIKHLLSKGFWLAVCWGAYCLIQAVIIGKNKKAYFDPLYYLLLLSIIVYGVYTGFHSSYIQYVTMLAAGIIILGSYCILKFRKKNPLLSSITLISCVVVCVEPLGTSNGVRYLTVFLAFSFLALCCNLFTMQVKFSHMKQTPIVRIKTFYSVLIAFVLVYGLTNGAIRSRDYVYRDRLRSELTASVDNPTLYGMRTSPLRAAQLETLVTQLEPYSGQALLAYGSIPLTYSLVPMPCVMTNPWPDLATFSVERFIKELAQTEREGILPVILLAHIDDMAIRGDEQDATKREIIAAFLKRNEYELAYKDEYFEIYRLNEA